MKSTAHVLYVMGGGFFIVDLTYLTWSVQAHNFEVIGLITLGLSATLCILMAVYLDVVFRSLGTTVLAEDRLDADIDDGDSEVGHFSPWSWWPILLAAAIGIAMLGLAISPWIALIAIPILAVTTVGWVFEYYRGHFAH